MAGRQRVEEKDRRVSRSVTLPAWVWDMVNKQGSNASATIEAAVRAKYEKAS